MCPRRRFRGGRSSLTPLRRRSRNSGGPTPPGLTCWRAPSAAWTCAPPRSRSSKTMWPAERSPGADSRRSCSLTWPGSVPSGSCWKRRPCWRGPWSGWRRSRGAPGRKRSIGRSATTRFPTQRGRSPRTTNPPCGERWRNGNWAVRRGNGRSSTCFSRIQPRIFTGASTSTSSIAVIYPPFRASNSGSSRLRTGRRSAKRARRVASFALSRDLRSRM